MKEASPRTVYHMANKKILHLHLRFKSDTQRNYNDEAEQSNQKNVSSHPIKNLIRYSSDPTPAGQKQTAWCL